MIGIFGGSFDPIHNGHLRAAIEVLQRLELEKILFIPCQQHAFGKIFHATAAQRLTMLQLAIQAQEKFSIDARELNRTGISYTIDTLIELRAENPDAQHSLIMGMDALLTFQKWQRWEEILTLANIITISRPGVTAIAATTILDLPSADYICTDIQEFKQSETGKIFLLSAPLLEISATYIRTEVTMNKNIRYLVPDAVADYIKTEKIYSS